MALETETPTTGASDTGTPSGTPSAPTQNTQQTAPVQPAAPTAPTTGFSYTEDRSKWVPPHRFNQVNEQAKRARDLETQLADTNRRLQALAGVTTPDADEQKSVAVKDAFFKMFPQFKHLANLNDEQMQKLISAPDEVSRATQIEQREWARHGKVQMTTIYSQVADAIGAEQLSQDQQDDVKEAFTSWFRRKCQTEINDNKMRTGEEFSQTLQRYEDGDPKLLDEFVARHTSNWVEPARRKVTQQQIQTRTRPVVNSSGRTPVTSKKPEAFKSLDERIDYAAKLFEERSGQTLRK